MRKWLAGRLIRLALRVYPPRVTEIFDGTVFAQNRFLDETGHQRTDWILPFLERFAAENQQESAR